MAKEFSKSFYHSKEWQATREYILKRDNYLCAECGHPAEEVHHIIHLSPKNIGDVSITMNPDNLRSLCRNCHFNEHRYDRVHGRDKQIIDLEEIMFDENGNVVPPPVKNQ